MAKVFDADGYLAHGVIAGLHYHKLGQQRSRQKAVLTVLIVALFAIAAMMLSRGHSGDHTSVYSPGFGGRQSTGSPPKGIYFRPSEWPSGHPARGTDFPIGYIGKYTLVRDPAELRVHLTTTPLADTWSPDMRISADGDRIDALSLQGAGGESAFSLVDDNFGLPSSPDLWRHSLRGLPRGFGDGPIGSLIMSTPPHARLANPAWPRDVWLVNDTAVVEGYLTLHDYGLISFELVSESHPNLGFAEAVQRALEHSTCYPATDRAGNRISVRCRYRCIFTGDGKPLVMVSRPQSDERAPFDGAITATVQR